MRTDLAIIGAGPAGLSAAVTAAARGKTVRVLSQEGTNLDKAENVDNYLGFWKLTGSELMARFREHAAALGIVPEKGRAANLMPMGDYFMINFGGDLVEATAVLLAIGVAKAREIPGEAELLGRGVSYCATCDGMLYRGKDAVVWGLSPDAVEETNFLQGIGVRTTLVARGGRPAALHPDAGFRPGAVKEARAADGRLAEVVAGDEILPAEGLFILRSAIAPTTLVPGLEMENGFIRVSRSMETNIPGLYAAGDCAGHPLQISKAAGEGLTAALQAAKYIDALSHKTGG